MAVRAVNNTITMRPNYEVLRRLSQFQARDEVIQTKEFGPVKVDSQRSYNNTTPGNNIAWGEVESVGRGAAWMLDKYRMDRVLKRGDIIGFDLSHQVSTRHDGEELFLLQVDKALCLFNPNMPRPEPLGVHILTVEEEGAGKRFAFSSKARGYVLPRSIDNGELKMSDSPHSKVKFTVERVLDVGGQVILGAERLVCATALAESALRYVDQVDKAGRPGPAYGLFQMERRTHDDLREGTWLRRDDPRP